MATPCCRLCQPPPKQPLVRIYNVKEQFVIKNGIVLMNTRILTAARIRAAESPDSLVRAGAPMGTLIVSVYPWNSCLQRRGWRCAQASCESWTVL